MEIIDKYDAVGLWPFLLYTTQSEVVIHQSSYREDVICIHLTSHTFTTISRHHNWAYVGLSEWGVKY